MKRFVFIIAALAMCSGAQAAWKLCIPMPDGTLHCLTIPDTKPPAPWEDPWLEVGGIVPCVLTDLTHLHLAQQLVGKLSSQAQEQVAALIGQTAANMELPEGFQLIQSRTTPLGSEQWFLQYSGGSNSYQIGIPGCGDPFPEWPFPWPPPWWFVTMDGLSAQTITDLAMLASIDALVSKMEDPAGAELSQAIQEVATGLPIPREASLQF